jgi:hypothetical protein
MRLNVFENPLYFLRVFNQCLNWGGEQSLETLELTMGRARSWLFTCPGSSWFDGFRVEPQQA